MSKMDKLELAHEIIDLLWDNTTEDQYHEVLTEVIFRGWVWDRSHQGHEYWSNVVHALGGWEKYYPEKDNETQETQAP